VRAGWLPGDLRHEYLLGPRGRNRVIAQQRSAGRASCLTDPIRSRCATSMLTFARATPRARAISAAMMPGPLRDGRPFGTTKFASPATCRSIGHCGEVSPAMDDTVTPAFPLLATRAIPALRIMDWLVPALVLAGPKVGCARRDASCAPETKRAQSHMNSPGHPWRDRGRLT